MVTANMIMTRKEDYEHMTRVTFNLFRALVGLEAGRSCRCCGESIVGNDPFGMSEGVCRPCRAAA
jgi:hypothetical protein